MNRYISVEETNEPHIAGAKAYNLYRLAQQGFSIPPTLVLPRVVAEEHQNLSPADLSTIQIPEHFAIEEEEFIVRSSSCNEDTPEHMSAGIYESYRSSRKQIPDHVVLCWQSTHSPRAKAYKDRKKIPLDEHLGIVLQPYVRCIFSGVLYTSDCLRRQAHTMILEITKGSSDAVTSGSVRPATWVFNKKTRSKKVIFSNEDIPDSLIERLFTTGEQVEQALNKPQDVEFVVTTTDNLILLQTRPLPWGSNT